MQSAKDMYAGLGNSLGEAWMLRELAVLERQDTKLDDAILHLEEARRIYTAIDDRLGIAETLVEMGELCRETGRTGDAQGLWQEAIAIFNELGLAADASYVQQRFG
jgi:tetratricopeptide (TPR) repeat protein